MSDTNGKTYLTKTKYNNLVEYLKINMPDKDTRDNFLKDFMEIMNFNPNNPQKTREEVIIMVQKQKNLRLQKNQQKELEKELEKQEQRLKQNRFKKPIDD